MATLTADEIRQHLPKRFKRGQGVAGPEFYGCCGTGRRPVILRNPYKEGGHFFMVGAEACVDRFKCQIAINRVQGGRRRVFGDGNDRVWVYGSRRSAVTRFLSLSLKVAAWNAEQREAHQRAREAARKGDLGAALDLGNF